MKVRVAYSPGKGIALETPFFVGRIPGSDEVAVFKVKDDPGTERIPCSGDLEVIDKITKDIRVSRCHVRVLDSDGSLVIVDHGPLGKGSTNGTKVGERELRKGESLSIKDVAVVSIPASDPSVTFVVYPLESKESWIIVANKIFEFRAKVVSTSSPIELTKTVEDIRSYIEVVLNDVEDEDIANVIMDMLNEIDEAFDRKLPPDALRSVVTSCLDRLWNALFGRYKI